MSAFSNSNLIAMLSGYRGYFDASSDEREMVVAGFVSSVEEWEQFEIAWRLTLAKYHVPYFHMKEFNSFTKAYAHPKWKSNSYRAQFAEDLVKVIGDWTFASVGSGMTFDLFNEYNKTYKLSERFNPYAICGRDCAAHVRNYLRKEVKSELPIAFIFDRGDEGRGLLMKEMEASLLPSPEFKRSRPDPKSPDLDKEDPPHVQLQASDFSVWELRRGERDVLLEGKRGAELRKSARALAKVARKRIWRQTEELDLKGLIQVAKIEKRK